MSKRPIPSTPTTPTKAVHHFHYHYFLSDPPHPKMSSPITLKRVRSDTKLRQTINQTEKTDVESNSSKQSWKDAINPEYQKASANTGRTLKETSPTQKIVESLRKQYSHRIKRVDTTESLHSTPRVFEQRERYSSTLLQAKKLNESKSSHQPSFGCIPDLQLSTPPQTNESSRFLKKRQIHTLNAKEGAQLTERTGHLARSQQTKDYRQMLLEQQCRFLRERFLEHYQRGHPEVTGSKKT